MTPYDLRRFRRLILENAYFRSNVEFRIERQRQQRRYAFLADEIVRLGSERSMSSAVLYYAKALAEISTIRKTRRVDEGTALRVLYMQRGAHAGVDVHELLTQLCRQEKDALERRTHGSIGRPEGAVPALEATIRLLEMLKEGHTPTDKDIRDAGLSQLHFYVTRHLEHSREKIRKYFVGVVAELAVRPDARIHFATCGYSRLVRDLLASLQSAAPSLSDRRGYVFLLSKSAEDTLDTRMMQYELKEQRRLREAAGESVIFERVIAVPGPDFVFEAVQPSDVVLFVMGTEAWSDGPRVLHPKGLGAMEESILKRTTERESECRFRVLFVGENFKRVERLSTCAEVYADSGMRMDLHGPRFVDHLICQDGIITSPRCSTASLGQALSHRRSE